MSKQVNYDELQDRVAKAVRELQQASYKTVSVRTKIVRLISDLLVVALESRSGETGSERPPSSEFVRFNCVSKFSCSYHRHETALSSARSDSVTTRSGGYDDIAFKSSLMYRRLQELHPVTIGSDFSEIPIEPDRSTFNVHHCSRSCFSCAM